MKKLSFLLIVSALVFTGCGGNIDVSVEKSTGGPASSMSLTLSGEGNSASTSTDLRGKSSFDDLDYGTYTITCAGDSTYSSASGKVKLTIWDQWFGGGKSVTLTLGKK